MDLPDEDNAALAKRRAIQALMKDKTLTPAERNTRMQAIIKGDFTDPGPPPTAAAASGGDGKMNSKRGDSIQSFGSSSSSEDDSSSSSSSEEEEDSIQGSTRTGRSGVSSASGHNNSKSLARKGSRSIGSGSGTGSGTKTSQTSSKVDPRTESAEHSTLSGTTHSLEGKELTKVEQQKERQKKLLEISRNTALTQSERTAAMKAVMQTKIEGSRDSGRGRIKKMGSINESITLPAGFDESSLLSVKHGSVRRLSSGMDEDEMKSIIMRLANDDPKLTELILEKRKLGDEEVIPIFDVFGGNTHVTVMNMRINRIGNEGCSALGKFSVYLLFLECSIFNQIIVC
jgi:uncharacterized protein (DUF305 family)